MKRIFGVFLIVFTLHCQAQEIVPVTFGPMVSMTSTTLNSTPDFEDQISGAGYNIGGFVRLKVLFLYAQGELSFGTKSASVTASDSGNFQNITFELNGADLSAIVGLKLFGIRDLGNVRIFGGYNWNNYSDITYSIDGSKFEASNVNNNNHSLLFGIGVDLSRLAFDIKYIQGFIDLTDSGVTEVESTVVSLTLAFKIL